MIEERPEVEIQDTAYAPPRYPTYNPSVMGAWQLVQDDGKTVGVLWTDYNTAAGVSWVTQTDAITALDMHFRQMKAIGAPATSAYLSAQQLPDLELQPEETGPLSQVDSAITEMMGQTA